MSENDIKKVAVIGAGTMGPGMAATFARQGFDTALFDVKPEQLEKARGTVDFVYSTLTNGGFMTAEEADAGRDRITYPNGKTSSSRSSRISRP
jgi:3-hydroxyacyl-CoA dehydrogenase